jgi:flagellar motility protein MotE (MotC chaperone)
MRQTIGIIAVVMLLGGFVWFAQTQAPVEYEQENREVISTPLVEPDEETQDEDSIERVKRELERLNKELDEKEQDLLQQREEIDRELERVRETRLGF